MTAKTKRSLAASTRSTLRSPAPQLLVNHKLTVAVLRVVVTVQPLLHTLDSNARRSPIMVAKLFDDEKGYGEVVLL